MGERINGASLQENAMSAGVISMDEFEKGEQEAVQMEGDFCGQAEFEEIFRWGEKTSRKCIEEAGSGLKILALMENLTDDLLCKMNFEGDDLEELIEHLKMAIQSGIARFETGEGICPECAAEQETE
mgnify:CR=1 FL=1